MSAVTHLGAQPHISSQDTNGLSRTADIKSDFINESLLMLPERNGCGGTGKEKQQKGK